MAVYLFMVPDTSIPRITAALKKYIIDGNLSPVNKNCSQTQLSYCSIFLSYGYAAVIVEWIRSGMPQPPEELADILGHIMDHGIMTLQESGPPA